MKPIELDSTAKRAPVTVRVGVFALKLALPILILAGGYTAYQGMRDSRPEVPDRPIREQVWTVQTMEARFAAHQPTLRLYGQTEAGREVSLRALVGGEIVEVSPALRVGALVESGTPLVRIDQFDYEGAVIAARANRLEAAARLQEIEAMIVAETDAQVRADEQLDLARRDIERAEALFARGAASTKTLDDRALVVSQREQAVEQRDSNLAVQEAKAAQQRAAIARLDRLLVEAERNLTNTTLAAPFSGYVAEANAEVGRLVSSNDVVVRLIDQTDIEVGFTLSDRQYGRIVNAEGSVIDRPVTVNWYVGDDPIRLSGQIARVSPQIMAATGGVKVFARITGGAGQGEIRPGAFVEVLVPDRSYEGVVSIPETAIYPNGTIFVVEDERLASRTVEVVGFAGRNLLVRGEIANGERVLLTKIAAAGDGLKVRDETSAPEAPEGGGVSSGPAAVEGRSQANAAGRPPSAQ